MRTSDFARALFGISVAALAALSLIYGNFGALVGPFPAWLPLPKLWIYGLGALLLLAGAGLLLSRTALASAGVIAVCGLLWALASIPPALPHPLSVGSWYGFCEAQATLVGAWTLYAVLRRQCEIPAISALTGDRALRVARALLGAAWVLYGAAHFAYEAYTTSMVPAWLPARAGFTYLTGFFHIAAGLGLLFGILPRLAAGLEAAMMGLFGLLVWIPSFFAHPLPPWAASTQARWSETLLTYVLTASAWIVAASLRRSPQGNAATAP